MIGSADPVIGTTTVTILEGASFMSQNVTIMLPDQSSITVAATVKNVARREESSVIDLGATVHGLYAELHVTMATDSLPNVFFLSRLVDEVAWTIDAHFLPTGACRHSNGWGGRYLITRQIAPELAALVDQAVRTDGLVVDLDQHHPLTFPDLTRAGE
ncbi:hypothetical protein ACFQ1S_02055 [Kibdelosporangium lantanae]|uniref:Uncharacterized protein n=1 Tax=Kibdelosporangium lantanae TaxID=1497396 RepID=A0ABW3M2W1_9PSEU